MARTSPKALLEVLPEPGARVQSPASTAGQAPPAGDRPTRRRLSRRWLALAAAGLIAVGVAFPVRSTVAVNELRRLDRRWAWYQALDSHRAALDAQLATQAEDDTDPRVIAGRALLAAEEVPFLRHARTALLSGWHLPDSGLDQLRRAMAAALADQIVDLDQQAATGRAGPADSLAAHQQITSVAVAEVGYLLATQLAQWQQQPLGLADAVPPLTAADSQLAVLGRPSDQPIDARLVLAGPPGTLTTADLGTASGNLLTRQTAGSTNPLTDSIVATAGYLAVASLPGIDGNSVVYALHRDLSGESRAIGSTSNNVLVAGADPGGVWLQSGVSAEEVDGTGAILRGPIAIGRGRVLIGATDQVLVTTGLASSVPPVDLQLVPLQGADAGKPSELTANGAILAATTGHLAWLDLDRAGDGLVVIRLADGAGHGVRTVLPPVLPQANPQPQNQPLPHALAVDSGAFSPDGNRLAVRFLTVLGGATAVQLAMVDVPTGATTLVDGTIGDHPAGPISWTGDGSRVFFMEATASTIHLGTWLIGTPRPTLIRVATPGVLTFAVTGR